jgi:hypothetical protein
VTEQLTVPPADAPIVITAPGPYAGMPEAVYHADPVPGGSLSSTGARKLLPPGCPAKFRYWIDNAEPFKAVFEEGKAAHQKVLGVGPELVLFPGTGKNPEAWQKADDIAAVAAMRGEGKVPLKRSQMDMVNAMAAALRADDIAGPLLDPDRGQTELGMFWRDGTSWGRARVDKLTATRSGRPVIVDYKTAASAAPQKIEKVIADRGYHVQGAFYSAGARALLVGEDVGYLLVFQEKEPPYLVTVAEPHPISMRMGALRVRQAFDLYAECRANDRWPGYADDVIYPELPPWETRELEGQTW